MHYGNQHGNDPSVRRISELPEENIISDTNGTIIHIAGFPSVAGIISERRGSRYAPSMVRQTLYGLSSYCTNHRAGLSTLTVLDHGAAKMLQEAV